MDSKLCWSIPYHSSHDDARRVREVWFERLAITMSSADERHLEATEARLEENEAKRAATANWAFSCDCCTPWCKF